MIPKWTPLFVTWLDAHSNYENASSVDFVREYNKSIRRSIGWLIHEDKERIVIAMDDDRGCPNDVTDCQTVTTIPRQMLIGDPTILKPERPKPKKK